MAQYQGFDQSGIMPSGILKPRATIAPTGVGVAPAQAAVVKPIKFELLPTEGKPAPGHINKDKDKETALAAQQHQQNVSDAQLQASQSGGSVICSRFYALGYMDIYSYALDDAFGQVLKVYEPELMAWYDRYAPCVVRFMRHDGWFVRWLWRHFGKHWSEHMRHEMNPCLPDNKRGALFMNIGRFLCKL
jgi:hypothetical protein